MPRCGEDKGDRAFGRGGYTKARTKKAGVYLA
jgi:hypothetical protein